MKHIFIINPRAGKEKENISVHVRSYIASHPELGALVFNTEYCGHETVLVGRLCHIFEDETIRLYICGGSGTLCRAICGIPNFALVEVAFFPCGITNDILKVFEGEEAPFRDLSALVDGTPMYLDLLDFGKGKALNFCSSGYVAKVASDVNSLARWSIAGTRIPYFLSIVRNSFSLLSSHYMMTSDGTDVSGHETFVMALNGTTFGGSFTPMRSVCPVNGKMKLLMYDSSSFFSILPSARAIEKGELFKLGKNVRMLECSELTMGMPENRKMYFTADGEMFEMGDKQNSVTIRVMPASLKFVLPSGVALKTQCREAEEGE
ncbi:MAG: hypothetical protein IK020_08730 [Clostridiales bacterium]|nr:hypothetical protein [Clostridiales bacterium]